VAHFDLEHRVDWIVVSGELGVDKPDPAIFEHVLGFAGVEVGRAAHMGDSLTSDVSGENRSGLLLFWVETRFPRDHGDGTEFTPAATIQHVRELLDG
jgi:putative hydrolase of the HAD superfamily